MPMNDIDSQAEFDIAIKNPSSVIIYSAAWSQIGEETVKNYERVGARFSKLYMGRVDIDTNIDLKVKYNITAVPTIVGYKHGAQIDKYIGPQATELEAETFIKKVV